MELRVIHYFLAVVQEKTISGAASQTIACITTNII